MELGSSDNGLGLGHANRSQYFLAYRELAQVYRRRVGSAFGPRRSLPGDDDLAMGSQGDFRGLSAKSAMTMAELVTLHRACKVFMERNAVVMAASSVRLPTDRAPAIVQMLWERHGILPRNLILVEVTHPKVPYIRDNRYRVTVFDREPGRGSVIAVEVSFGFMEEPNVERLLEDMARHHEIDLPFDRRQWVVHASQENLLPSRRMGLLRRLRFRLFLILRLVSQPAYYYYGLGDAVQLSVEIIPVRVR